MVTDPVFRARIQEWVDKLRSGGLPQGTSMLRTADSKFCCLGVACEISKVGEWRKETTQLRSMYPHEKEPAFEEKFFYITKVVSEFNGEIFEDKERSGLPIAVQEYYGFCSSDPKVMYQSGSSKSREDLSALNDGGMSFKEIADLIEKEYLLPKSFEDTYRREEP